MNRKHILIAALSAFALGHPVVSAQTSQQLGRAGKRASYGAPPLAAPRSVDFVATAATGVDMNAHGDIIGTSYLDVGCGSFCLPPQDTVVWRDGQRIVLPSLPGFSGITVRGINDQGWVVGLAGPMWTVNRAVLWKPVGNGYQAIDLGTLPGKTTSEAIGIDEMGRVLGWSTTTNFPPSGAPFLWTEDEGMVDLTALGFPSEMPLAISPGGTVATIGTWYRLDDPTSVVIMPPPPPSFGYITAAVAINDGGDQGRFLRRVGGQGLVYLYRFHREGVWQQLSPTGTGSMATYGMGSINSFGDVTATVLSTGVVAFGPDGLAQSLEGLVSPAYPGSDVTFGGPQNARGEILVRVMIGNSARLARLSPLVGCASKKGFGPVGEQCLRVDELTVEAEFIPDPSDPTQDHCAPELNAHNEALVSIAVTDAAGFPLEGALVIGRFLDDYWTDDQVVGTTGADGRVAFPYTGLCGVGAIAFLVDDVLLPGFTLDRDDGVLTGWAIPAMP
jgi:hypothetical protein